MRPPALRASFESDEIFVDSFCGGGGASEGVEQALGRPVDIAINHDAEAIEMHRRNHPETKHYTQDIYSVDPAEACRGRRVGALWSSPSCTHFSRALGTSTQLNAEIRDLADVIITWAEKVRPRAIFCENVVDWLTWGALIQDGPNKGRPDPKHRGEQWRAWVAKLVDLGYEVQWRELVAADFGAPTTRKRLYVIARCDGYPIIWPEPTHGVGRGQSWRQAHEIIEWHLPARSLFGRKKALAEATMKRVANGVQRFVIGAREPFIVRHGHFSHKTGLGDTFRGQPLTRPLSTVCSTNDRHLVLPFVAKNYGGPNGNQPPGLDVRSPLGTITCVDHHRLIAAFAERVGANVDELAEAGADHAADVRALLQRYAPPSRDQLSGQQAMPYLKSPPIGCLTLGGESYAITDLLMRQLSPRELYRAQGFRDSYIIDGFTQKTQNRLVGNSVVPQVARAIVAANLLGERAVAA